ncbi:MAG: hypothetical protein E7262_08870 [Lachnospiraceae bacterium]|nr:hypothetical protein [Lachnospiraceae bacterium]
MVITGASGITLDKPLKIEGDKYAVVVEFVYGKEDSEFLIPMSADKKGNPTPGEMMSTISLDSEWKKESTHFPIYIFTMNSDTRKDVGVQVEEKDSNDLKTDDSDTEADVSKVKNKGEILDKGKLFGVLDKSVALGIVIGIGIAVIVLILVTVIKKSMNKKGEKDIDTESKIKKKEKNKNKSKDKKVKKKNKASNKNKIIDLDMYSEDELEEYMEQVSEKRLRINVRRMKMKILIKM